MTAHGRMVGVVAAALVVGGLAAWSAGMPIDGQGPDATKGAAPPAGSQTATPVLVELFTSEGCSSCPPADKLLGRLVNETPINGTDVIALGYHVDYWDRLGWKDRFSSAAYTERQNRYAAAWKSDQIYTPQTVVDGRVALVGTDAAKIVQAIADARSRPRAQVTVSVGGDAKRVVTLDVAPPAGVAMAGDVFLVVAEDGLATDVKAGENANRRIEHSGVVRRVDKVGRLQSGQTCKVSDYALKLDPSWKAGALRAVAIVQDDKTRAVLGVGQAKF
jgi:hypothetical protein